MLVLEDCIAPHHGKRHHTGVLGLLLRAWEVVHVDLVMRQLFTDPSLEHTELLSGAGVTLADHGDNVYLNVCTMKTRQSLEAFIKKKK